MPTYAAVPTSQAPVGVTLTLRDIAGAVVPVVPNPDGSGSAANSFVTGATVYAPEGAYQLRYSVGVAGAQQLPVTVRAPTPPPHNWAPDWTPLTYYRAGLLVVQNGALYRRKSAGLSAAAFDSDAWDLIDGTTFETPVGSQQRADNAVVAATSRAAALSLILH